MVCACRRRTAAALVGGFAFATFVSGGLSAGQIDTVSNLEGKWAGSGSISYSNGEEQRVKCLAQSVVGEGQAQQNLRCASPSSQISVNVSFFVNEGHVRGKWSEERSGAEGGLYGHVEGESISLRLHDGKGFSGVMRLTSAPCIQDVAFSGNGNGSSLRSAFIQLRKC